MILGLYRAVTTLAGPLIRLYLNKRLVRGKEDPARFSERLGRPGLPRPEGFLVWIHAASVGESLSMLPLVERLLVERPGLRMLMTTGSVTSARLMGERLPEGATHQFVPVDRLPWVRSFLDHWRPDLVLWAESEFWPNLVCETAARGLPMVLLNGRISDRSFERWQKHAGLIAQLLSGFALCLGQTGRDAERLRVLGAPRAECLGNLKFAAPPLPADAGELAVLEKALTGRPRWLAASTHAGEEGMAGRLHQGLRETHPGVLTIIAPRHPERGDAIAAELRGAGLTVAQRSKGETPTEKTGIYLTDTLGELGLFFRLADAVFMGKSLVPLGGQNPLEPARLGRPVLFGPHMGNFEEMAGRMKETGAALEVADEADLGDTLARLLSDTAERERRGGAARAFAEGEAGVMEAVLDALGPWLPEKGAPERGATDEGA